MNGGWERQGARPDLEMANIHRLRSGVWRGIEADEAVTIALHLGGDEEDATIVVEDQAVPVPSPRAFAMGNDVRGAGRRLNPEDAPLPVEMVHDPEAAIEEAVGRGFDRSERADRQGKLLPWKGAPDGAHPDIPGRR
ncbi:MAG: hypothetical protein KC731_24290, partial [Myxococcales bacterium]|nr:hypothetical protein [Myxococcales bacterium]